MRTRDGKTYRRKSEAERFRVTLMSLRDELKWSQEMLAAKVGVSARTVSNWENGYWLPPLKQRLHFLVALRDVPPGYVLALADQLGLASDPAHDAFLQPYRAAVDGEVDEAPAPARPAVDPAQLKRAVDGVLGDVAATLGAKPGDLRAGIARVLAACEALGATIDEVREAVGA